MNKSFWGIMVITLGVTAIFFILLFQNITTTDEHNSQLLKEVTEAAMWDAVDYGYYRHHGVVKINQEKFVENFMRRFAQSASTSKNYTIKFYDVNEFPPKVSVQVISNVSGNVSSTSASLDVSNKIDAILETPY